MKQEYQTALRRLHRGTAHLIIDDPAVQFLRGESGTGAIITPGRGIILKAKLDKAYVSPERLRNRKVFYALYRNTDCKGTERTYLWLASRSGDWQYWGERRIIITSDDIRIELETDAAELLAQCRQNNGFIGRHDNPLLTEPEGVWI